MLPPGKNKFYFTTEEEYIITDDNEIEEWKILIDDKCITVANVTWKIPQTKMLYTKEFISQMKCMPRPPPKALIAKERLKTPWDFFKSVFKDYRPDNQQVLNDCFEYDWSCWKIPKLIKDENELEELKKLIKSHYKAFREAYKYLGAINPAGLYPSIGSNVLTELIANCNSLVDNQTLNLSDIDLEFVATNAGTKNNPRHPERQLVRYQLMEYFVRVAKTKFIKNKICDNIIQAFRKIYDEHLKDSLEKYDCHKWRTANLWNENWDYVFKRYLTAVKKIYDNFSGKYALPGAPRFMSADEFYDLVDVTGIVNDDFGQREINPIFNCSMMTQKDELNSDKHINMTLVEFIEAIGRMAEKVNCPIPFEYMELMLQEFVEENPKYKENPPLHYKIEALIGNINKSIN